MPFLIKMFFYDLFLFT